MWRSADARESCFVSSVPVGGAVQVKAGICCAHLESDVASNHGMHEAHEYFGNLLEEPLADTADLCLTVADELLQLKHAEEVCFMSVPEQQCVESDTLGSSCLQQ